MNGLGQASLLYAFAASGYAAFACLLGVRSGRQALCRLGRRAGVTSICALTISVGVLAWALVAHDFGFLYVRQYSNRLLPWSYRLSALWVGQAGSLLLWAWMLGALSWGFLLAGRRVDVTGSVDERVSDRAFGLLMGYLCFLVATLVFAADPMGRSIDRAEDGTGLSPLLQHPAMLIHPPVVFLAYAGWTIPCALMLGALGEGQIGPRTYGRMRVWGMFAWALLGMGILLGAQWSYEELGWGGYWAWDPVENASLVPWLTGTAFLHTLMASRARGVLRKTTAGLAIATFGLCNLASFLTRSGIFSSLHAFSRSPIGWLFLGLMGGLAVAGGMLIARRRGMLSPERPVSSLLSCEAMVAVSTAALVGLAMLVTAGTVFVAASEFLVGRRIVVGPDFYNAALVSSGVVLLATIVPAPLLQWGSEPSPARRRGLVAALGVGCSGFVLARASGIGTTLAVIGGGLLPAAVCAVGVRLRNDMDRRRDLPPGVRLVRSLIDGRRSYCGFLAHLGLVGLTVGVAGSSLGTIQGEFEIREGQGVSWAGQTIRFAKLERTQLTDKTVFAARLLVTDRGGRSATLRPAQHYHHLQGIWTTEAAVLSRFGGDFYAVVRHGEGDGARFLFLRNPLMWCVWAGGWLIGMAGLMGVVVGWYADRGVMSRGPRLERWEPADRSASDSAPGTRMATGTMNLALRSQQHPGDGPRV